MLFKKLYSMFPVGWGEGGKGLKSVLFDIGTISLSLEDHNNILQWCNPRTLLYYTIVQTIKEKGLALVQPFKRDRMVQQNFPLLHTCWISSGTLYQRFKNQQRMQSTTVVFHISCGEQNRLLFFSPVILT